MELNEFIKNTIAFLQTQVEDVVVPPPIVEPPVEPPPPVITYDYYVSPTGNDTNDGSQSKPWKTLKKATDTAVAGKRVFILPGTYAEKIVPKNSGTASAYITYTAEPETVIIEGTGIAMVNDDRGDGLVQIQGKSYIKIQNLYLRNSSLNAVNISQDSAGKRSSFIEISGLKIENCKRSGIRARSSDNVIISNNRINHIEYSSGIAAWWCTKVLVDRNTITNAHYYHECQGAFDEALTISGTKDFEVSYNILDNTEPRPSGFCTGSEKLGIDVKEYCERGKVHHNTVKNMNAGGIYVDGWTAGSNGTSTLNNIDIYSNYVSEGGGITVGCERPEGTVEFVNIYNNVVVNAYFSGIQVRGAWGDGLRKNIRIFNNTVYGASPTGGNGGAGIYVTTENLGTNNNEKPVIIKNNISMFYFLANEGGSYVGQIRAGTASMASKVDASNNLVKGPQICSQQFPSCVEVGGRITGTPVNVFVNPSSFDLHLKDTSPAIDKGAAITSLKDDFDGVSRPKGAGYDIGAFERVVA